MNYNWIDIPLVDGMAYFCNMFFYFSDKAVFIGKYLAFLGIIYYAIQMMYASVAVRQAIVKMFFSFVFFFLAMTFYHPFVGGLANIVTSMGVNAGSGKRIVERNLVSLMKKAENDLKVAKQLKKLEGNDAAKKQLLRRTTAIPELVQLGTPLDENGKAIHRKKGSLSDDLTDPNGNSRYLSKVSNYRSADENIEWAEKTILALKDVLKPTKYRDRKGNLVKTYYLDVMLKKGNSGIASNFLSPNAILRVALLTAQVIRTRQTDYMTIKIAEAQEDSSWYNPAGYVGWMNLSLTDIGNMILTWIVTIAIILAAIFAIIQYSMTIFEYAIVTSIGVIFLPFMLFNGTKSIAAKTMQVLVGFAIKLLIVTLTMFFMFYQYIYLAATQMGETQSLDLTIFAYIAFMIILSFIVTQNAPQIAGTILSGSPQLSMGEFMQAAGTVGAGALMAKNAARGAKNTASAAVDKGRGAIGTATNLVNTTRGIRSEAKSARQSAQDIVKAKGGSSAEVKAAGTIASREVYAGHAKNAVKNKLHNLSHASATSHGGGSSQGSSFAGNGKNRFSAKDAQSLDKSITPEANKSSFRHAMNDDGTAMTNKEYQAHMKNQGADIGAQVAARFNPIPPKPSSQPQVEYKPKLEDKTNKGDS